ncbi:MAG: polysaccharide biosynthesis C-terminal domain-containing protein [Ferruginibacter sp.]
MVNNNFLRSIFSYTILSFFEKGMNFALTFLLSYYLLPGDMGILSLYLTIYMFLHPFINLYTNGANMLAWQQMNEHYKGYFTSALLLNVFSFIFFTCLFFIFFSVFDILSYIPFILLLLMPFISYLETIKLNFLSHAQAKGNVRRFGIINITAAAVSFSVTFYCLHFLKTGYSGRIVGLIAGGLCVVMLCIYYLRKEKLLGIYNPKFAKDALKYGVPLIPHAIGAGIIDMSDRIFINYYVNKTELGLYSVAYTFTSVLTLISVSFLTAWSPRMNALLHENTFESKTKVAKTYIMFLATFVIISVVFILLSPFVFRLLMDKNYDSAVRFLPWITLYYFLQGFYFVFSSILFFTKKTKYFMWVSLLNIALNLVLNFVFVTRIGAVGAAIASVISMAVFTILIIILSNRLLPMPWKHAFRTMDWSLKSLR